MAANHRLVCARAARREYAEAYRRGIQDFRRSRRLAATCGRQLLARLPESLPLTVLQHVCEPGVVQLAWEGAIDPENAKPPDVPFRVVARIRPLLPPELEEGTYSSLSAEGGNNAVVVHDGRVHRDGRTLYMVHSRFCLDGIFASRTCQESILTEENEAVYTSTAQPLLRTAIAGGRSTLLLFGQTGTGKTYTAHNLLSRSAQELFEATTAAVHVYCYEIAGTHGGREEVFDLLAERKRVKCLTGEDEQVHVRGARAVDCTSAGELQEALLKAFAWRSSEATERNEASSRSHAIIEVHIGDGVLRVVDLAGSERNFETQMHTRKMAERGGNINYSLCMLKECARIMHRNQQRSEQGQELQHIPFRGSRVTHLLKSCFVEETHRTVVIATLSPSPTDVEHSLNSLQHVGMMRAGCYVRQQRAEAVKQGDGSFSKVEGRGHNLHSKLQDARAEQLKLHAFGMVTGVGGSVMKRYEPENVKTEAFIDPRWHREMNVDVERDLWVLREADAEVVQILSEWREEQWELRKAHDISRWDARSVNSFISSLELPGEARVPSTMTGAQLLRLGKRALAALCSDEATAEALCAALAQERAAAREALALGQERNARMTALGTRKAYVVLEAE